MEFYNMYHLWLKEITCLHHISEVHYQRSRNGGNIDPLILIEDLKATHLVLEHHIEESTISMFAEAQSQIWFGTCWITMAQNILSLNTTHIFEVIGFEPKSFWQQLKYGNA